MKSFEAWILLLLLLLLWLLLFLEGSISREQSKVVFTRLRHAQNRVETSKQRSLDSSPHFKHRKAEVGRKKIKKEREKESSGILFSIPSSCANGFCIHRRVLLTISSAAEHSSGKLQSWELLAASPSPISLLLTQSVSKAAGTRCSFWFWFGLVCFVLFWGVIFYFFLILKDHTEQSFAKAELQLPLERDMAVISHQVQTHHQ